MVNENEKGSSGPQQELVRQPLEITCPKCSERFPMGLKAVIPASQKMTAKLTLQRDGMIGATTLGKFMDNMAKVLKESAKSLGGKVEVFIGDVRCEDNAVEVTFVIVGVA